MCYKVKLDRELNGFHREDYFLANIARTLAQVNSDGKKEITLEPFLLKFQTAQDVKPVNPAAKVMKSKSFWASIFGAHKE